MTLAWIVGRGGMLGAALWRRLIHEGTQVFVPQERFDWCDEERLRRQLESATRAFAAVLAPGQCWEIYWAAGLGTMASSADSMAAETRLLQALLAAASEQPGLLQSPGTLALASSAGAIYAGSAAEVISEATDIAPTTAYAHGKLAQEQRLQDFSAAHRSTRAVIGRIATLYGPQPRIGKRQGLIAEMARRVVLNQPIHIYVPLDTIRDYLAVDDAADAMVALVRSGACGSRSTMKIIASEQATTISEIVATFKRVAHRMPRIVTSSSSLTDVYRRRIQFRSDGRPIAGAWPRTSLTAGVSRVLAAERLAFRVGVHQ